MRDFERAFGVACEQLHILFHCALMHAKYADFAHIRVGNDFEYMRQYMLACVRFGVEWLGVAQFAFIERWWIALRRVWRERGQNVQQLFDTRAGLGGGE